MRIRVHDEAGPRPALREMARELARKARYADDIAVLDFEDVETASRSFMDEIYRTFADPAGELTAFSLLTGMNGELERLLKTVGKTQRARKHLRTFRKENVRTVRTAAELEKALSELR